MLVKTVLNTNPKTISPTENLYSHVVRVTYSDGRLLKDFMVCSKPEADRLRGNLYRLFVTKLNMKDLSYRVIDLVEEAKEIAERKAKEEAEAKAKLENEKTFAKKLTEVSNEVKSQVSIEKLLEAMNTVSARLSKIEEKFTTTVEVK